MEKLLQRLLFTLFAEALEEGEVVLPESRVDPRLRGMLLNGSDEKGEVQGNGFAVLIAEGPVIELAGMEIKGCLETLHMEDHDGVPLKNEPQEALRLQGGLPRHDPFCHPPVTQLPDFQRRQHEKASLRAVQGVQELSRGGEQTEPILSHIQSDDALRFGGTTQLIPVDEHGRKACILQLDGCCLQGGCVRVGPENLQGLSCKFLANGACVESGELCQGRHIRCELPGAVCQGAYHQIRLACPRALFPGGS